MVLVEVQNKMKKSHDERESENKSGSFINKFFSKFRKSDKNDAQTVAADAQTADAMQSAAPSFEPAPIQPSYEQPSPIQDSPVLSVEPQKFEETVVETASQTEETEEPEKTEDISPAKSNDTASVNEEILNAAKEDDVVSETTESAAIEKAEKKTKAPSKPRAKKATPAVENAEEQKETPKPKQKFKVEKTGAYYQSDDSFMRFGGKSDLNSELFSTSFEIGSDKNKTN